MSDTEAAPEVPEEEENQEPTSPITFEVPDKPFEELTPLEQRWFKIKQIPEFPLKVKYYGDCGLPLEYCEFLPEQLRNQAIEVIFCYSMKKNINKIRKRKMTQN